MDQDTLNTDPLEASEVEMGYEEKVELPIYRPKWSAPRSLSRLLLPLLICGCATFLWLSLSGSAIESKAKAIVTPEESIIAHADHEADLVKYTAVETSVSVTTTVVAPTSTGVLEVFQVYQPVLTPKGVTDETTLSNGAENTTTIAATESTSACELLLMDHSFGFSYGLPFVGNAVSCPNMTIRQD